MLAAEQLIVGSEAGERRLHFVLDRLDETLPWLDQELARIWIESAVALLNRSRSRHTGEEPADADDFAW